MNPARFYGTGMAAVLSVALAAGCASSPDTDPASAGELSVWQIEGDADRMVCRQQQDTGSRLSSRVCKTVREWEQERIENQDAIRNATRSGVRPGDMPSAGGG